MAATIAPNAAIWVAVGKLYRVMPTSTDPRALPPLSANNGWSAAHLLLAPHRFSFFLAILALVSASAWWALVQMDRTTAVISLPYAVSPSLGHAVVMTFGFIPLFFSGFLFTAGPKWLKVRAIETKNLIAPLVLQASGWILWIAALHFHVWLCVIALFIALTGLVWITSLFWSLIRMSKEEDQLHARTIGVACALGCCCLAGLGLSVGLEATDTAHVFVLSGLWGFIAVIHVTVAHRMIPFFTSSAMPFINAKRPFWALGLMLGVCSFEVACIWLALYSPVLSHRSWLGLVIKAIVEVSAGLVLVWLAIAWGLMQSLKNRLLAMLHIGFLWFALSLLLSGSSQLLGVLQDTVVLPLGSLHALTMGSLGSLMLAMVTRVSCGHSGRPLLADRLVWSLFCLLQLATLLRIGAAMQSAGTPWLLLAASLIWLGIMGIWGIRLTGWYGRLRADGAAG